MPKSYHQKGLKEKLIKKAKEVFLAEGLKAVTIRRISKELGVSPMAFYHYFADTREFINQIAHEYILELDAISELAVQGEEPGYPKLHRLGKAYINYALQNPKQFLLMFTPGSSPFGSEFKTNWQEVALYRILVDTVSEILILNSNEKTDPNQIQIAAISAWSLVHGLAMLLIDGPLAEINKNPKMLEVVIDKVVRSIDFGGE